MIASALEGKLGTSLETGENSLRGKLDLLYLCDTFVEKKLHSYETEKKRDNLTNVIVQDDHEMLKNIYLENLEKCTLLVTLPSGLNTVKNTSFRWKDPGWKGQNRYCNEYGAILTDWLTGGLEPTTSEYYTVNGLYA